MSRPILVAGANKGIGLATVRRLLGEADDAFVFLGSRDTDRGEAARDGLIAAHPAWAERVAVLPSTSPQRPRCTPPSSASPTASAGCTG